MEDHLECLLVVVLLTFWAEVGFVYFHKKFKENPMYDARPIEFILAGPFIWLICMGISIYNAIFIKKP